MRAGDGDLAIGAQSSTLLQLDERSAWKRELNGEASVEEILRSLRIAHLSADFQEFL